MTRAAVLAGLSSIWLLGCSSATVTIGQADREALDLARGAVLVVGGDPTRAPDGDFRRPIDACVSDRDFDSTGQQRARHSFQLADLPMVDIGRRADLVIRHADQQGFELTTRQTIGAEEGFYFENDSTDATFSVRLTTSTAVVISESACVWPDGRRP